MINIIRLINIIILGYILNLSGLFLNLIEGNKTGATFALLSFAFAYLSEGDYISGTNYPRITTCYQFLCILFCAASIAVWFF